MPHGSEGATLSRPARDPRLPVDEVHIWQLPLDVPERVLGRLEAVLSSEERARADRFVFAPDRARHVAAHGWLRLVLAGYLGRPAAALQLAGPPGTKPRLAGPPDLRFSLAHSGDLGLLAVALARDVGIDLEAVRPLDDLDALAATCLSDAEAKAWAQVPEPLRLTAFFETWTRKEAFVKAVGAGLARPLGSFDVTVSPGEPARLLRVEGDPSAHLRFEIHPLRPAPGFVGALAVEGQGLRVSFHRPEQPGG